MSQFYAPDTGVVNEYNYGTDNSTVAPLPFSIDYTSPQATGIQKKLKRVIMYPSGISSQTLGPNDTFRFVMNAQEFLDPMSTCLKFNVSIPTANLLDNAVGFDPNDAVKSRNYIDKCLQLDDSAQSFISSFHAYCGVGGEDIERIDNYDVIAAFLNDVASCNAGAFRSVDYSGCGGAYGSHFNNITYGMTKHTASLPLTVTNDSYFTNEGQSIDAYGYVSDPTLFYDPSRIYHYCQTKPSMLMAPVKPGESSTVVTNTTFYNPSDVKKNIENISYPIKKIPAPVHHLIHDCPNMGFDTIFGDGYGYTDSTGAVKVGVGRQTAGSFGTADTNSIYNIDTDDNDQDFANYGSANPFPVNFGKTAFEPIFTNVKQKVIKNGVPACDSVTELTFIIPLLSGVFGSLMQPNNYKLIPMPAFQNLTFEFKLNPYALFTSFSSTSFTDRSYRITSMELQMDMIEFMDLNVIDATNQALRTGFVLCTQSYYAGPELGYENNVIPRTIQINMGFDSMRALFMVLLDSAYKRNTMFRKQYRLSGNITSMQLKIGTEYFPQQPIEGHAGNNYGKINNYDFYLQMLKCFNKINTREEIGINLHNFAINWRELYYAEQVGSILAAQTTVSATAVNPTKPIRRTTDNETSDRTTSAIFQTKIATTPQQGNGEFSYKSFPALCCNGMQMGLYLENRCIGKALFGICCTPANYENNMLEGKNTTVNRPFDLLLNSQGISNNQGYGYAGSASLMIFIYYDLVISFSNGTVRALGRS